MDAKILLRWTKLSEEFLINEMYIKKVLNASVPVFLASLARLRWTRHTMKCKEANACLGVGVMFVY